MKVWTDSESQEQWLNALTSNTSERQQMKNKTFIVTFSTSSSSATREQCINKQSLSHFSCSWKSNERVKEGTTIFRGKNEKVLRIWWFQVTGAETRGEGKHLIGSCSSLYSMWQELHSALNQSEHVWFLLLLMSQPERPKKDNNYSTHSLIKSVSKHSGQLFDITKKQLFLHCDIIFSKKKNSYSDYWLKKHAITIITKCY